MAQQPPFPSDSVLKGTLHGPSTVSQGPSEFCPWHPHPYPSPTPQLPHCCTRLPRTPVSSTSAAAHLLVPNRAPRTRLRVGVRAAIGVRCPPGLPGERRLKGWGRSPGKGAGVEAGAVAAARRHRCGPAPAAVLSAPAAARIRTGTASRGGGQSAGGGALG